jgi:peptidylprolyl isomerase
MKSFHSVLVSTLLALTSTTLLAQEAGTPDLDAELNTLLESIVGRYSGEVADPTDASGERRMMLHHKIVRVDLPNFGEYVLHHQISRDALDSETPWQQKIYIFDQDSKRRHNTMRAFVIPRELGLANFEGDPVKFQKLALARTPVMAELQGFPDGCKISWERDGQSNFVARVRREKCRYESSSFRQRVSASLTYRVTPDSFGIEETFFGDDGKPLFPQRGLLTVARKPSTVAAVLAASKREEWRRLDPERTIYMELDSGRVIFELSPTFAPRHVENIRALARSGWFDGLSINRVQDNFVTQWGDPDGKKPIVGAASRLPAEFERSWTSEIVFSALPDGDVFAPEAGFVEGFWAAGDRKAHRIWLAHCYGTLGVGRDTAADSGSGAELYVVIGQAPRQLDRNITVAGRAVSGMELLAALPRGTEALGFYKTAAERTPIRRFRLAADVPAEERTELELLRTDSESFAEVVEARRNRRDEWYKVPAGQIDLCSAPLPVRRVTPSAVLPNGRGG